MRTFAEEFGSFEEGQREVEINIVRRTKIRPTVAVVSKPKPLANAVASLYGDPIPVTKCMVSQVSKIVGKQVRRYRWLTPDANGNLVPKENP